MLQSIERGKHTIAHAAPLCTIAGAVFIANAPLAAQAAAYHVAATGNDGNPGTADAPWQTLTTSANKLKPGDILYLHAGIYAQTLNENASGTASAPITIMAPPGELPVIDGTGVTLHDSWAPLCSVSGDYVTLSGLEVRHSSGVGMVLSGRHDVAKGINMHHTWDSGIALMGDYCTAIENRVWQTNLRNAAKPGSPAGGSWGSALHAVNPKAGGAVGVVIRNNIVFNNWGEGLNVWKADNATVEGNVAYDNWAVDLYLSNLTHSTIKENLIYEAGSMPTRKNGLLFAQGDSPYGAIASHDNVIINNLLYQASMKIFTWFPSGITNVSLKNTVIAHNTIVGGELRIGGNAPHYGSQVRNNIADNGSANSSAGIIFSH